MVHSNSKGKNKTVLTRSVGKTVFQQIYIQVCVLLFKSIIGSAKKFEFFHKILHKNLNKLFGQPNILCYCIFLISII